MAFDSSKPANHFCGRTRREMLWQMGGGFLGVALAGLLDKDGFFDSKAAAATVARNRVLGANPLAPQPSRPLCMDHRLCCSPSPSRWPGHWRP